MFGVEVVQPAIDFVAQYGLLAVFLLLVMDAAMLLPGLPGEVIMIVAVNRFVHDTGDLVELILLTTLAAVVGSVALYGVARAGGARLVEKHPRLFMMDPRKRAKFERAFRRPTGKIMVLVLRFVPLTRVLITIPAGVARMRFVPFLVLTTVGMLIFQAGFLWLAYEYNRPESAVAREAASLQTAYGSPAWEYVQANDALAIIAVLLFGAFLSLRSSRAMLKDPELALTSLIGWLSVRLLVWGSIALSIVLWLDPELVLKIFLAGGLDVARLATLLESEPVPLLAFAASIFFSIGFILVVLEGTARRRRRRALARKKVTDARAAVHADVQARARAQAIAGNTSAGPPPRDAEGGPR